MAPDEALSYNYDADSIWQSYYTNLEFVTPPSVDQINKIKRKWYTKNVNPEYNRPAAEQLSTQPGQNSSCQQASKPQPPASKGWDWRKLRSLATGSWLQTVWFVAQVMFLAHVVWFMTPLIGWDYHVYRRSAWLALATYCLPLFSAHGMIKFNQTYAERALLDSNSHYVYYALVMVAVGMTNPLVAALSLVPLAIYSAYSMQAFVRRSLGAGPGAPSRAIATLDGHKARLNEWAIQAEVGLFPLAVVTGVGSMLGVCAGSAIQPLLYYNFLKMRYVLSPDTRALVSKTTNAVITHPRCPAFVHSIYAYMSQP